MPASTCEPSAPGFFGAIPAWHGRRPSNWSYAVPALVTRRRGMRTSRLDQMMTTPISADIRGSA